MPRWPAASSTTPRAWPTANAERTLAPKYSSSTATASGRCSSSSSPTRAWIAASRAAGVGRRRGLDHAAVERHQPPALARDDAVARVGGARIDAEDDHLHGGDSARAAGRLPRVGRAVAAKCERERSTAAVTRARARGDRATITRSSYAERRRSGARRAPRIDSGDAAAPACRRTERRCRRPWHAVERSRAPCRPTAIPSRRGRRGASSATGPCSALRRVGQPRRRA